MLSPDRQHTHDTAANKSGMFFLLFVFFCNRPHLCLQRHLAATQWHVFWSPKSAPLLTNETVVTANANATASYCLKLCYGVNACGALHCWLDGWLAGWMAGWLADICLVKLFHFGIFFLGRFGCVWISVGLFVFLVSLPKVTLAGRTLYDNRSSNSLCCVWRTVFQCMVV